jgi:Putative prokaryotic signal transducing protein
MKTVATFSWLDEAYVARATLEGNGMRAYIPDELTVSTRPLLGNAIGGVRVQVEDEEYERARQILRLPPIAPPPAPTP